MDTRQALGRFFGLSLMRDRVPPRTPLDSRAIEVRHSFTNVAGVKIHWAEAGTATFATPVVLLHGLQDCHLTWMRVASSLARSRRVLMPDLPGHGLSERPDAAYDLPWYARVTGAWLKAIGLAKADVVGHSLGGGIAQMLLLESRDRIRRMVLAASGGLGREITLLLRLASMRFAKVACLEASEESCQRARVRLLLTGLN